MDGKLQLESKEDMKARGIPSPNRADALALTFAHPVYAIENNSIADSNHHHVSSGFNPFQ
jgi:hypothetical protein